MKNAKSANGAKPRGDRAAIRGWRIQPGSFLVVPFAVCLSRAPKIALALTAFVFSLSAAPTNSPGSKLVAAKSEAIAPAELLPAPQSVFVIPKRSSEGKDPFFPNATRVYNTGNEVKPKGPVVTVSDLTLKGISGTAAEPLAIINTTTFTTGEDNDVITTAGRMRVRCVEINMALGTVLVQVGGERRELRLQSKK